MARKILVVDDSATLRTIIRKAVLGTPAEDLGLEALAGLPDIDQVLAALELGTEAEAPKPLEPAKLRQTSRPT